ncbi:hypothetical protein JCM19000A_37730 [Silvimonas sp. JCM 19000]
MKQLRLWAALLALALLAACGGIPHDLEKPRVTLAGINFKDANLLQQRFTLALDIQNPNNISVPISGLNAALSVNGEEMATGVSNEAVTIPALGDVVVHIDVVSNLAQLLRQVRNMGNGQAPSYKLAGKLFLPIRPDGIAFEKSGELPPAEQWLPKQLRN